MQHAYCMLNPKSIAGPLETVLFACLDGGMHQLSCMQQPLTDVSWTFV